MPDESCRKCGNLLVKYDRCENCMETIQFSCSKCNLKSDLRFHLDCNINAKSFKYNGLIAWYFCNHLNSCKRLCWLVFEYTKNAPVLKCLPISFTMLCFNHSDFSNSDKLHFGYRRRIGAWTGTAEGMEKPKFYTILCNHIGFVFFLAIIHSLIITPNNT